MSELLTLHDVSAGYGESVVVDGISLDIKEGDSLALLGRNGVGKTSLLITLMGLTRVHRGTILWKGRDVLRMSTHERARAGLGWVPQERYMFPSLTVEEHLTVVARPGKWDMKKIYKIFPRLQERRNNMGNQLSGGEQQMLAIARALMINPQLLLLDEPMEGLAPIIVQEISRVIRSLIVEYGMSVIVVEQHAHLALSLTKQAIVLDRGQVSHASDSKTLISDPDLLERLIGVG